MRSLNNLAELYRAQGKDAEAEKLLRGFTIPQQEQYKGATIELDPSYAEAYYNRGIAYAHLKEYERAIKDFDQAIVFDSSYAAAYYNRGLTYQDLKEYEQAIQDYDWAIELDPSDAGVYNNRGLAYACLKGATWLVKN